MRERGSRRSKQTRNLVAKGLQVACATFRANSLDLERLAVDLESVRKYVSIDGMLELLRARAEETANVARLTETLKLMGAE
jgi:septum formation topological specificity factor MinE